MSGTFCGKHCEECLQRTELACPGCQEISDCKVKACCLRRGRENCSGCVDEEKCYHLLCSETMAEERVQHQDQEKVRRYWVEKNGSHAGKWLCLLFAVSVAAMPVRYLASARVSESLPAVSTLAGWGNILLSLLAVFAVYKLSIYQAQYRMAAVLAAINVAASTVVLLSSSDKIILMTSALYFMIGVGEAYYQYNGHGDLLEHIDDELSQKWRSLWKWMVGLTLCEVGTTILPLLLFRFESVGLILFGTLLWIGNLIGLVVIDVIYYLYLYKTAKLFRLEPDSAPSDEGAVGEAD